MQIPSMRLSRTQSSPDAASPSNPVKSLPSRFWSKISVMFFRSHRRVVVHRNGDIVGHELLNACFLVRSHFDFAGWNAIDFFGQLETLVIRAFLEILKRFVAVILLVGTHERVLLRHKSLAEWCPRLHSAASPQ